MYHTNPFFFFFFFTNFFLPKMETLAHPSQISPNVPHQPLLEPLDPLEPTHRQKLRVSRLGLPPEPKTLAHRDPPHVTASDFAPDDFLARVRGAACDVSVCRLLDASVLRSCATAFVRANGLVVTDILDLVDVDARNGPEVKDGLSPRRKKKSVAELISVLETTRPASSRKHKPKEIFSSVHLPSVEVGSGVAGEGFGSPRRERKKSKYLSPPYTFDTKQSNSSMDKEGEETKDVDEDLGEGKMSASRKYAGISADVILSQLLLAASDPLCPKSNRPGRAIWGFFVEFRIFLCSGDPEFQSYLKSLEFSGGSEKIIVSGGHVEEAMVAKSAENSNLIKMGGSEPRKRGRKLKSVGENLKIATCESVDEAKVDKSAEINNLVEVGGNVEAGFSLVNELRKRGRKPKKDYSVVENSITVNSEFVDEAKQARSVENNNLIKVGGNGKAGLRSLSNEPRKRGRKPKKDQSIGENSKLVSGEFVDEAEVAKYVGISNPVKVGGNVEAGLSIGNEPKKRRRKTKKDQSIGEKSTNMNLPIENYSHGKSDLVMRKTKETATNSGDEGKGLANGGALHDFDHNIVVFSKSGQSRQKRKRSSEEGPDVVTQSPTLVGKVTNGSEVRTARQTRREEEGNVAYPLPGPKHPLSYLRENIESMILTLTGPSSGIVSAESLKPEVKENLVLEMQGLLNKVNHLQTGTNIAST